MLSGMPVAAEVRLEGQPVIFNDDGGWCWFEDERVIVHAGKLVIGSVAAGVLRRSRELTHLCLPKLTQAF